MMNVRIKTELRLPAIEIRQGKNRRLYTFAVDGKSLPSFTTVSRIFRGAEQKVEGYQRPEVLSHIAEIREYIESEAPMIPNAIVVAFDERVLFVPSAKGEETPYSCTGTLIIPIEKDEPDALKPGWIVDGQQRAAAIRDAKVEHFPICVVSFIAKDAQEQREQFILVNSTKPLPKGLVYELLPVTEAKLPSLLQRRRFPTVILDRLNLDPDSPLKGLIKTPTVPGGMVKDNSLIKMLENSLSDGVLYRFRVGGGDKGDIEAMLKVLKDFWGAVAEVFVKAWGLPPRRSRLMHGAGIVSLGFLMDAIADRFRQAGVPTKKQFKDDLEPLRDACCWTDGHWEFGPGTVRKWNELQNTHKDIQMLANYVLVKYKALVWNKIAADTK